MRAKNQSPIFPRLNAWLALASMAVSSAASAFTYVMPEDASLVKQADGAIVGVIGSELAPAIEAGQPYRRFSLRIESALAGAPLVDEVVLRLPGSPRGAAIQVVTPGVPLPAYGDRMLVLYSSKPSGDIAPVQLSLGMFFETTASDGERVYVRNLDGADEVAVGKRNLQFGWPRAASQFEAWIASSAAWSGRKADYFATDLRGGPKIAAKFNLARAPLSDPRRLFLFDSGQTMQWQAAVGGPGGDNSYDFATAVTEALKAWSDDVDSRVNFQYAGTFVPTAKGIAPAGSIIWDDPNDEIPGSYDCVGGVLAVTQVGLSSPPTLFDGTRFHPIVFARIVTQDNTACHFPGSGGLDGHELLTHEIGHGLGLSHACSDFGNDMDNPPACAGEPVLDDAIMRARVHRSSRGTRLGADDKAGLLRLYPSPTYVHPQEMMVDSVTAGLTSCTGTGSRDASSSADGSVIVFQTTCTGGVAKSDGEPMVMVLDRKRCAKQLGTKADDARCSQKNWTRYTKAEPVASGIEPSITADGRFAVFVSNQPQTTKADPVGPRSSRDAKASAWTVWMRNLASTGATSQIASGMSSGAGTQPQVSPDGLTVTFVSDSQPMNVEIAGGGTFDSSPDVFQIKPDITNPDAITPGPIECASCKEEPNQPAGPPTTSATGTMVAYNLGNTLWLRNMVTGTSSVMVPGSSGVSTTPSMDYSGNNIVFQTTAPLDEDGSDDNGKPDVYMFEACCNKFTRISKPDVNVGAAEEMSQQPVISGNGRSIAFVSAAQNLMGFTPEPNSNRNVYVYDTRNRLKRRYSRGSSGVQSNGDSERPYLNYTGNMALFDSSATNLDGADGNGVQDVFQRANPLAEFVVFDSGFD